LQANDAQINVYIHSTVYSIYSARQQTTDGLQYVFSIQMSLVYI